MALYLTGINSTNTDGNLFLPGFSAAKFAQIRFGIICHAFNSAGSTPGVITLSGYSSARDFAIAEISVSVGTTTSIVIDSPPEQIRIKCSRQANFSYAVWGVPLRDVGLKASAGRKKSATAKKAATAKTKSTGTKKASSRKK